MRYGLQDRYDVTIDEKNPMMLLTSGLSTINFTISCRVCAAHGILINPYLLLTLVRTAVSTLPLSVTTASTFTPAPTNSSINGVMCCVSHAAVLGSEGFG